jgi:hypothetical protein
VLTTMSGPKHERVVSVFPAAATLYKLVGPFTGLATDPAACRQRHCKVADTLCELEQAVRAQEQAVRAQEQAVGAQEHAVGARPGDAPNVDELFALLAHGVGLPDVSGRSWSPLQDMVGKYVRIHGDAVRAADVAVTDCTTAAARAGRNMEQARQWAARYERALNRCVRPAASASKKAKKELREYRERVKELQQELADQQRSLEAEAKLQATHQQRVQHAVADHRMHLATAWAWRVLFGGALPRVAAPEAGGEREGGGEGGGGGGSGSGSGSGGGGGGGSGGASKRKCPFTAAL